MPVMPAMPVKPAAERCKAITTSGKNRAIFMANKPLIRKVQPNVVRGRSYPVTVVQLGLVEGPNVDDLRKEWVAADDECILLEDESNLTCHRSPAGLEWLRQRVGNYPEEARSLCDWESMNLQTT